LGCLRALPGVRAAATAASLPGMPGDSLIEVTLTEGRDESQGKIIADSRVISNGYFATMSIPFLAGETAASLKISTARRSIAVSPTSIRRYISTALGTSSPLILQHLSAAG